MARNHSETPAKRRMDAARQLRAETLAVRRLLLRIATNAPRQA